MVRWTRGRGHDVDGTSRTRGNWIWLDEITDFWTISRNLILKKKKKIKQREKTRGKILILYFHDHEEVGRSILTKKIKDNKKKMFHALRK
jgi:hypothetical protein